MMAADILFNILLLTLLLTLTSCAALLFRRRLMRGRERAMRAIWAAILLTAVVPFYSGHMANIDYLDTGDNNVISAQPEVLYADTEGYDVNARRDIDLARRLYGGDFTAKTFGNGNTVSAGQGGEAFFRVSNLLFGIWLAGAVFLMSKSLISYFAVKKVMQANSRPDTDPRIAVLLTECRARLGMKRNVSIRVIDGGYCCSPCVAGLITPTIYIGSECADYSDSRLWFILMHELCHVRNHDLPFKLYALIVTSLHWFNPISRIVYRAVTEDCELACDDTVLKILGRRQSESYMITILDIAEHFCESPQPALANRMGSGLFMSGSPGKRFLERRYRNMKYKKSGKFPVVFAALFIIAALTANLVVMSSCGVPLFGSEASSGGATGNIFLDEAIRGYYGLAGTEKITAEMIRGIETLVIRASDINSVTDGDVMIVDYIVNGREILPLPKKIEPSRFEENYIEALNGFYLENNTGALNGSYLATHTEEEAANIIKKVNAFYCLNNYYDPALDDDERAEMLATLPDIVDYPEGYYLFDPYASAREIRLISNYYETAGLYTPFALLGEYFDASRLAELPGLVSVTYMGVTPVNENLPDGCTSESVDYTYNDIGLNDFNPTRNTPAPVGEPQYGGSKGESGTVLWNGEPITVELSWGLFELEEKGMKTDENGVDYLVFNSKALHAALLEYYVMEYSSSNKITAEHLAQITSIEAVIRTDLDYLFDDSLELHGGHYIQFAINGESQGLIPAYYNAKEFPSGKTSDMLYDSGYYELVEDGGDSYYKLVGDDDNAIAGTFRELATLNGYKSLIIGSWDEDGDGSAAFITENPASWDCVAARYVNGISIAQNELELDRQHFPNLQTFDFTVR
jgi:beta-lactamase regulating signal transducer with metallopeptidase domain